MLLAFLLEMKNGGNMTRQTVNRRWIKWIEKNERIYAPIAIPIPIPIPSPLFAHSMKSHLSIENIKRDNSELIWLDGVAMCYKSWDTAEWKRTLDHRHRHTHTHTQNDSQSEIVKMRLWNNVKKLERQISFSSDYFFENNSIG